ncbi:MAG: nitroreductase [Gammaproteobacteria bacterium]|nr:nitroreductase [Gammaproteobacteria bacterium]
MNVNEAVEQRFSARAFLDRKVSIEQIRGILDRARRTPSGGNLQPWHVCVVAGQPLAELQGLIRKRAATLPRGETSEYNVYPPDLQEPYRSRRFKCGEDLYASLGIPREDKTARFLQFAKNLRAFGAPTVLFFSIDRKMGRNQWAHLGMFMQTVMLLAVEEGLATCPQESWSAFHGTIADFIGLPDEQLFYCGMAVGYADMDHPINQWRTERAPVEDFTRFLCEPG